MHARIGAGRGRGCQLAFIAAKVEGEVERVQEVGGKGRGSGSLLMNLAAKRAEVEEEDVKEGAWRRSTWRRRRWRDSRTSRM